MDPTAWGHIWVLSLSNSNVALNFKFLCLGEVTYDMLISSLVAFGIQAAHTAATMTVVLPFLF